MSFDQLFGFCGYCHNLFLWPKVEWAEYLTVFQIPGLRQKRQVVLDD